MGISDCARFIGLSAHPAHQNLNLTYLNIKFKTTSGSVCIYCIFFTGTIFDCCVHMDYIVNNCFHFQGWTSENVAILSA